MSLSKLVHTRLISNLQKYNAQFIDYKDGVVTIKCQNNHTFDIKYTSLGNKLRLLEKGSDGNICATCHLDETRTEEETVKAACNKLNFEFIQFDTLTRKVVYKCCCGSENEAPSSSLLRKGRKAQCLKCQNNDNKHSIEHVKAVFESEGCELLEETYINKHTSMSYRCRCGTISKITYGDLVRGKRCRQCKSDRTRETCIQKYGVDNPSKDPEIFRKILANMLKKKEFVYGDKKWRVMGYEQWCLEELINSGVDINTIYAGEDKEIPSIDYTFKGATHVWYPDIYVGGNKVIEVKSTWTYNMAPDKMLAKMSCCECDCELWIYEESGEIFDIIYKINGEIKYKNNKLVLGEKLNL